MTTQNGRAFNEWLRAQLKAKKMSQRQLAQQSGVDHSTISRLIRGDRMPSLGTATKLARGLRELRDDADTPQYLGLVAAGNTNPTARVEYALRADELLSEPQVRQIMEYYLAVRMRRYGRTFQPSEVNSGSRSSAGSTHRAANLGKPGRGRGRGHRQHGALRSRAQPVGNRGATSTHQGTTRIRPPRSGSRGQRTPASGAPAFAIPGRGRAAATRRLRRRAVDRDRPARGGHEPVHRRAEPIRRGDDVLRRAAARRPDRRLEQRVADDDERSVASARSARSPASTRRRSPRPGRAGSHRPRST